MDQLFDFVDRSTPDLMAYFGRALNVGRISQYGEGYSFNVLLLTFLVCNDPISNWFQNYTRLANITLDQIFTSERIKQEDLEIIRAEPNEEAIKQFQSEDMTTSLSQSARGILIEAVQYLQDHNDISQQDYSVLSSSPNQTTLLDVHYIMASLIYGKSTHHTDLQKMGFDLFNWSVSFLTLISDQYSDELNFWMNKHEEIYDDLPDIGVQISASTQEWLMGFSSDTIDDVENDLIGIDDDVNPLAALIAARNTHPPLAIGIFGNWGAGKTFFMNRLKKRINEITHKARTATDHNDKPMLQKDIDFYKNIVQIDFNAWHYVEGELWAGLVQNIFFSLQESNIKSLNFNTSREDRKSFQEQLLQKRTEDQPAAQAEVDQAERELKDAQRKLATARVNAVETVLTTENMINFLRNDKNLEEELRRSLSPLITTLGIEDTSNSVSQLFSSLKDIQHQMVRGHAILLPIISEPKRLLYIIIVLIIGPLVAIFIGIAVSQASESDMIGQLAGIFSGLSTLMAGAVIWLQNQAKTLKKWIDDIEKSVTTFETTVIEHVSENKELIELEQEVQRKSIKLSEAQYKHQDVQDEILALEAQVEALAPGKVLNSFIQSRLESGDYRNQLGITALIRQDFEELADEIINQNLEVEAEDADENTERNVKVNRIVLYIDDLDRCPPEVVTEVLQAVHLLLAFKLFVVIVGVDARWVSRALQKKYPDLLVRNHEEYNTLYQSEIAGTHHSASPHDYLEKIFQIPLWLEPIGVSGTQRMIESLLADSVDYTYTPDDTSHENTHNNEDNVNIYNEPSLSPDSQQGHNRSQREQPQQKGTTLPTKHNSNDNIKLKAENLRITADELETMDQLAILCGRSPRSVKRFVNCYRLIKASLDESQLSHYIQQKEFRPIMLLLSIVTGMPDLSALFFKTIAKRINNTNDNNDDQTLPTLSDLIIVDMKHLASSSSQYHRLELWINDIAEDHWKTMETLTIAKHIRKVARYSFRVDRI